MRCRLVAAVAGMALAVSCSSDGPAHGKIVGDVYIAPAMDREVSLAGATVRLVAEVEDFDSTLARACPYPDRRLARAREATAEGVRRSWDVRQRFLSRMTRRVVRANAAATYRIDSIEPGRYRLWADTVVGDDRWTWLHPVRIRAGDSLRVNLSNANADENPFQCK